MLAKWFINRLQKVMEHNEYDNDMLTTKECTPRDRWTPTDLILREYYNNGGGSAMGFLGLTRADCIKCYNYIYEHQKELVEMDYINENGYNNCGFPLWSNYKIH